MARKQSAEARAAQIEYEAAPEGEKPSALVLAARHSLHRTTVTKAPWFDRRPYNKKEKAK